MLIMLMAPIKLTSSTDRTSWSVSHAYGPIGPEIPALLISPHKPGSEGSWSMVLYHTFITTIKDPIQIRYWVVMDYFMRRNTYT